MFVLLTSAKSFRASKWVGNARLNAWGLHVVRKKIAGFLTSLQRALIGLRLSRQDRQTFRRQGYFSDAGFLSGPEFDQLRDELCVASWKLLEMAQPPARTLRANLDAQTCDGLPVLARLVVHPLLRNRLRYAAGCFGIPICALQIVRSEGVGAGHDPQTDWHRDTFHAAGKAWFFLHAVAPGQGPFGFVPGSHDPTAAHWHWEHQQSISAARDPNHMHANGSFRTNEEGLAAMGYAERFMADVAGNTLVVADTSGFHRRTPSPGPTVRLEIYFSLRRNPFFSLFAPSLLGWPLLRERWAGWVYRYCEWRLSQGRPSWIPLGQRPLEDDEKILLQKKALPESF